MDSASLLAPAVASQEAVARTVYLQVPPAQVSQSSLTARLAIVYLASFALTTLVVMGAWTNVRAHRPPPVPPPPEVKIVEVEKPVPVPVPVAPEPPPAPVAAPVPEERPAPKPPPKPTPRPPPKPTRPSPAPAPVVVAEPAPVVPAPVVPEPVAPAPPPPPAPVVPQQARALSGAYAGKGGGEALSISLAFGADGKLSGKVMRAGGVEVPASGTYQIIGDQVSFVLLESAGEQRIAYSGTVNDSGADGRMTLGGQNLGRFSVDR